MTPDFLVLEVFVHNNWEPWAIFFQVTEETAIKAVQDAKWKVQPLRMREGTTADWGGLEACIMRMEKSFRSYLN